MTVNINHCNRKKSPSKIEVTSAFFTRKSPVMDDSGDFQDKKKSIVGPKTTKQIKLRSKKSRVSKKKQIRGQKDIRTALNAKCSNVVTYSREFDNVCKQSGLDVDAEQLQLAIALSKSEQPESIDSSSNSNTELSSTQDRIKNIRTTLFEYGFKVPEIKINPIRRRHKFKRSYKLLTTTDIEQKQVIADRYSQILAQNISSLHDNNITDYQDCPLFNLATSITYETLRDIKTFHVENLIEISVSSVGSSFKNWAEIPGRPVSPIKVSETTINFDITECTILELDTILSGTFKMSREMLNKKKYFQIDENSKPTETNNIDEKHIYKLKEIGYRDKDVNRESSTLQNITHIEIQNPGRSISPDIFDEDISIVEASQHITLSQEVKSFVRTKLVETMDLTDCIEPNLKLSQSYKSSQCNKTSHSSVDMEITNCVVGSSHSIRNNYPTDKIYLTQAENNAGKIDLTQEVDVLNNVNSDENCMDLTQSSNSNDDTLPCIQISSNNATNLLINKKSDVPDTITLNKTMDEIEILNDHKYDERSVSENQLNPVDSSTISEPSNFENFECDHIDESHKLHDSHNHTAQDDKTKEKYIDLTQPLSKEHIFKQSINIEPDNIDLTQSSDEVVECNFQNASLYKDNDLGKQDNLSIDYDDIIQDDLIYTNSLIIEDKSEDTTQLQEICSDGISRHKSDELNNFSSNKCSYKLNDSTNIDKYGDGNEHLEDYNDVSLPDVYIRSKDAIKANVDYVEQSELNNKAITNLECKNQKRSDNTIINLDSQAVKTPSNAEYTIKTDKVTPMLDYESMSTPERNMELKKFGIKPFKRKRAIQLLTHLYNQTHPIVDSVSSNSESSSPMKKLKQCTSPKSIKSPNKIKSPRKIFHSPESTEESSSQTSYSTGKTPNIITFNGTSSPSKSTKSVIETIKTTTKSNRNKSPIKKVMKNSNEVIEKDRTVELICKRSGKEDIYKVTNDLPDIRSVECCEEDWVFQKREKAKLHACRVPLHIAFHNYVTTRQKLLEAILRYEPINIDTVHKELVAYGHRYDPKDLLKFLDKKCITVKTADNNSRNKR